MLNLVSSYTWQAIFIAYHWPTHLWQTTHAFLIQS
jgi:hypothetical protein